MDPAFQNWLWLGGGLALVASEAFVPKLITAFLGLGALTVAAVRFAGLIDDTGASMALWGLSSAVYLVALRKALLRWLDIKPESTRDSTSESARTIGSEADVLETIEDEKPGRIRFEGTTWEAHTTGPTLPAGTRARLVRRDNLAWVVEPADAIEPVRPGKRTT